MDKSCLVGTTIGVSNSALCQGAAIVHASSSSDVLYLTMAHEIGHNLGMEHLSIEEDGIMEAYVPVGGLGAAELRPNPEIDSSTSGIGYNDVWRDSVCTRLSGLQVRMDFINAARKSPISSANITPKSPPPLVSLTFIVADLL